MAQGELTGSRFVEIDDEVVVPGLRQGLDEGLYLGRRDVFDAIHLAAALTLRDALGDEGVAFSSFDTRLNRAAVAEGLIVLELATG